MNDIRATTKLMIPPEIESVIAGYDVRSDPFSYMDVHSALMNAHKLIKTQNDKDDIAIFAELLAFGLTGTEHNEKPWGTYFGPMGSRAKNDGMIVYFPDATQADEIVLSHWKERTKIISSPTLVARYSDLVWDLSMLVANEKRDVKFARLAIDGYLAAAAQTGRDSYDAFPDAERAILLAIQIGDVDRRDAARKTLLNLHHAEIANGKMWWRAPRFFADQPKVGLNNEERHSIMSDLENILTRARGEASASRFNPHDVESAAKMLEPYYRWKNASNRIPELHLAVAQAFEKMGKMSEPMLAGIVFQTSADAYHRAGKKEDAARVQILVEESNLAAAEKMIPSEFKTQISNDDIEKFLKSLIHGTKEDTFNRISLYFLIRRQPIEEQIADDAKHFPLSTIVPQSMMQGSRVVAEVGALAEDPEGHLIMQASRHLSFNNIWLTWAIDRGKETYGWTCDDIATWANRSGLFGDAALLRQGVEAWFENDHVKAVHILVPQIEAAFRKMARVLGLPTTKSHPQMSRARVVIPLGELLWGPEIQEALGALGPDLVLHMRALYADPRGHNLRNDLAHGLIVSTRINAGTSLLVVHSLLVLGAWLEVRDIC